MTSYIRIAELTILPPSLSRDYDNKKFVEIDQNPDPASKERDFLDTDRQYSLSELVDQTDIVIFSGSLNGDEVTILTKADFYAHPFSHDLIKWSRNYE